MSSFQRALRIIFEKRINQLNWSILFAQFQLEGYIYTALLHKYLDDFCNDEQDWWKFNGVEQAHMRVYVNVHNINRHMDLLLNLLSSILALRVLLSSTWIIDMVEPNRYHAAGYNQARNHLKYTQSLKGIVPNFEYITFFSCTTKRNIYLCFIYIFKR